MKDQVIEKFFNAYWKPGMTAVYGDHIPKSMMLSEVTKDGWFEWKLIPGTLTKEDYRKLEATHQCKFPELFIEFHRRYFFPECDCGLASFGRSLPGAPLKDLIEDLSWPVPENLIPEGYLPFAHEGNDAGNFVFDMNNEKDGDCPVLFSDIDFVGHPDGLSGPVFSSFEKMLVCLTQFLKEQPGRPRHEIISDFFIIDPKGAGESGRSYWRDWIEMERETFNRLGY